MDNIKCDHCGCENPIGGVKEYNVDDLIGSKRPQLGRTYTLCQVCRQMCTVPGNMSYVTADNGARDLAACTNMILKVLADLRAQVESLKNKIENLEEPL